MVTWGCIFEVLGHVTFTCSYNKGCIRVILRNGQIAGDNALQKFNNTEYGAEPIIIIIVTS